MDVLQLVFNATGTCEKQWNCTANCTNDDKLFRVDEGNITFPNLLCCIN